MAKLIDLTGQKFGRLTVISRAENTKDGKARWICDCDCGTKNVEIRSTHLISEHTKSCGCLQKEIVKEKMTKHSQCGSRLYEIWSGIKRRTMTENRKDYKYYKDVDVCDEWANDFETFYKWALNSGYEEDLTLDRKNNKKGYSPSNCRWVTMQIQGNNKRNNRIITYKEETKTLSEWAKFLGLSYNALVMRLHRGQSVEKAFTTPIRKRKD